MEEILIKTDKKDEAISLLRSAIDREIAFIKTSLLKTKKGSKNFNKSTRWESMKRKGKE